MTADAEIPEGVRQIREWGKLMWEPLAALSERPQEQPGEATLDRLNAESAVDSLFRSYHNFYDANDLERVLSLFSNDCVVINPRGTYIGKESIRRNYAYLMGRRDFVMHYGTNPLIRFDDASFKTGWLSAFYLAVSFQKDGPMWAVGGTYMNRVRLNTEGRWEIFQQRITGNFRFGLSDVPSVHDDPPPAELEASSGDLLEDRYRR